MVERGDDAPEPTARGLHAEKKRVTAAEQDAVARAAWWEAIATVPAEDLVFIDETNTHIALTRRYGRAPRGERVVGQVPRNHGTPTTLVAALGVEGLRAEMTLLGAMDREAFLVYVREVLCPVLRPGQVVVLDNLSVHKGEAVRALVEGVGAVLHFLPSYSPDFSPIELVYSKVKEALRAAGARTQAALDAAITHALLAVTPHDALASFRHCGYQAA